MGDFCGTGIEIWAEFGLVGSTEKKGSGPIMNNFRGWFFSCFQEQKNVKIFFKNIVASALKSCVK